MKTEAVETNIFKSNSQLMAIDPAQILPLFDRLLIRDIKDPDKIGSIWIPETAAERGVGKNGLLRLGIVVAVGKGDPWAKEKPIKGGTEVVRKALGPCSLCAGTGLPNPPEDLECTCDYDDGDGSCPWYEFNAQHQNCPECGGDGIRRWPMYCRVGDTVIVDRRKEAEFYIDGERFYLCHEEQAVLAILSRAEGSE